MSLLRSSKFVRYFVNFARNIVIVQPKNVDKALLERSRSLINSGFDRTLISEAGLNSNINPIDKSIKRLDQDVRRTGRISRKELLDVFDEIRHTRQATGTQCLLIIRCCGNLVPEESPEVRTRLVNEIWDTFEKIGVSLDVSHYNALLRVYLENEHQFSPTEFLTMLENKGVEPNRVTFQRLISAYCQRGDIEGATRILEFMKEKQIPVNEGVFNSLIVGHSQADDMDSAVGILGVMNQANIEPSANTYTALLCGYARRGDIENIGSILKECKEKDVELMDKDILEVAFTLAVNNHSEHLDEVLGQLKKTFGYNQDAKNVILRLLVKGEDDAAVKVLRTMTPPQSTGIAEQSGSFLVKQMVKLNRPVERILSLCAALKESGENEYALHHALEASLVTGTNPETSLKLLSALSAQEAVCQHYYWPVLVQYGKAKNSQGMYSTLRQLTNEVGQSVAGETLKDYVIPYMTSSTIQSIHELRQAGVSIASAAAATVASLLASGNIKEATRIALQFRANYNSLLIRRSLVSAFLATKDVKSFVTMVQILKDVDTKDEDEPAVVDILLDVVESLRGEDKIKMVTDILQSYLDNGIGLSNETAESLQNSLGGEELTHEISTLLSKLTSVDLVPKELHRPPNLIKTSETTEEILLNQINASESDMSVNQSLRKDLLMFYCRNRELEKAQELYKKLEAEGYDFPFGCLISVMDLYVHFDMLEEATKFYNLFLQSNSDMDMDDLKLIKYALLLSKNDKLEEALNLFKKHNSRTSEKLFSHTSVCWKLLNLFAEKKDIKVLKELFNVMKEKGFLEPSNVVLGPLIKVHLMNDDLPGALDQFEECCNLYRATPWKNELACRFIQNEDATSLQRLTDLSTQIHGEMNSLYDLVLSFIECGRIRQARKILETPGLRSRAQRINSACEKYTSEGKANHLESLVQVTKDLSHIDRAEIYYHLLKAYCNADEVDKAVGLWTQMQEEDVQPGDNFLFTLGNLLKKHDRPIPFAVPEVEEKADIAADNKDFIPPGKLAIIKSLRKAVYGKDVDEALQLKNSLNESDLTPPDKTKLLNLLTNSGRLREASSVLIGWLENNQIIFPAAISHLINTLAKLGDVDSIEEIGKHLNKELRKAVSYVNRYTHCMVEAGRAEEVLTKLLDDIKNAKTPEEFVELSEEFPRGGLFPILKVHPQFLPKVEEIAIEYRNRGLIEPTNVMWMHFFINGDDAKEEEYWNYIKSSDRIMFLPILKHCRITLESSKLVNLLNRCKESNMGLPAIALIHSTLIDLYIKEHRLSECEKIFDEYLESNQFELLSRNSVLRAKRYFESCDKLFKYPIPPEKIRKGKTQDTSSSSDSDADEKK